MALIDPTGIGMFIAMGVFGFILLLFWLKIIEIIG